MHEKLSGTWLKVSFQQDTFCIISYKVNVYSKLDIYYMYFSGDDLYKLKAFYQILYQIILCSIYMKNCK